MNFSVFEAIAVESPACNREISMRALRVAIKKHLEMDSVDFAKLRYQSGDIYIYIYIYKCFFIQTFLASICLVIVI